MRIEKFEVECLQQPGDDNPHFQLGDVLAKAPVPAAAETDQMAGQLGVFQLPVRPESIGVDE